MIAALFERVTGRPWTTTRSMAAEFGPTPATRYLQLSAYSDAELLAGHADASAPDRADNQAANSPDTRAPEWPTTTGHSAGQTGAIPAANSADVRPDTDEVPALRT